jgi:hypothetical protein
VRTWTSTDGRTLQAQYIESTAGKVTIKMGSREYTLPHSRFSQADQICDKSNQIELKTKHLKA